MSVQNTSSSTTALSAWAEIIARYFSRQPDAGSRAEVASFQREIEQAQSAQQSSAAAAFAFEQSDSAAPPANSEPGLPADGVPAVVHHFRPIYFGQPEMPKAESEALGAAAIETLNAALRERGIDPSRVRMNYVAHYFNSPAGGVPTRMIRVETADGRWEEFSADWTLLKPQVTVCEIESRLLGGSAAEIAT
jgi:hypothetical protein